MRKSRFNEEKIIGVLKEVESGGKVADVCRRHAISEQRISLEAKVRRARRERGAAARSPRGGESTPEAVVADLTLDNQALKAVASKKW